MFKGLGFLGGRSVAEFLAPSELNGAKNIQLMEQELIFPMVGLLLDLQIHSQLLYVDLKQQINLN